MDITETAAMINFTNRLANALSSGRTAPARRRRSTSAMFGG